MGILYKIILIKNGGVYHRNPNITWDIIQNNPDKDWNWYWYIINPNITWDIIQNNPDKRLELVDYISRNPNITWDIIQNNPDKPWDWHRVYQNIQI